jgi:hypothetical protein
MRFQASFHALAASLLVASPLILGNIGVAADGTAVAKRFVV